MDAAGRHRFLKEDCRFRDLMAILGKYGGSGKYSFLDAATGASTKTTLTTLLLTCGRKWRGTSWTTTGMKNCSATLGGWWNGTTHTYIGWLPRHLPTVSTLFGGYGYTARPPSGVDSGTLG